MAPIVTSPSGSSHILSCGSEKTGQHEFPYASCQYKHKEEEGSLVGTQTRWKASLLLKDIGWNVACIIAISSSQYLSDDEGLDFVVAAVLVYVKVMMKP